MLGVEKPARYAGGEYGRLASKDGIRNAALKMAVAFPDLYEIGMSNHALRILYNRLNRIPGLVCDRVFAPAPDFEALLRDKGVPLYGLDTGVSIRDLDILGFTLGYELGITGVLAILASADVPILAAGRTGGDPVVIMGGPCVSNPLPYAPFIDAFWIGEAEGGFFELAEELAGMRKEGAGRDALLSRMKAHPSVWAPGKTGVRRAVDAAFASGDPLAAVFPISGMKIVQHHGALEIMRGCPNGCRFCHAGVWYRPMRQKDARVVLAEADAFIRAGGYRKISLSSLSSGDYRYIDALLEELNRTYSPYHVSFQLPSLRVSTFSLPILGKISAVRRSGLTFAVETPVDAWQLAINKEVSRNSVIAILKEARKNGWRGAKFYFMVGLPVEGPGGRVQDGASREEEEIVAFIRDTARKTGMNFNVNVGAFVPKPHTPFQWAAQINEDAAREKLEYIRRNLKPHGHKVGIQDPFISVLEGIISRGDERVGGLIAEAFNRGCRLDAWDDYIRKDLWRGVLENERSLVETILGKKELDVPLPWDSVSSGTSLRFLTEEARRSSAGVTTPPCAAQAGVEVQEQDEKPACGHPCGLCPGGGRVIENTANLSSPPETGNSGAPSNLPRVSGAGSRRSLRDPAAYRLVFSFAKSGPAVWLPHLAVIEVFAMALQRAGIPVQFSEGFNPLPKLDFASPISLGVFAGGEIATVDTSGFFDSPTFTERLNSQLPEGFRVNQALAVYIPSGMKKHSAASLLWGFAYEPAPGANPEPDLVPAAGEKQYRQGRLAAGESLFGLRRKSVLAKCREAPHQPASYFSVYQALYPAT
ncbi:MAG: TIGR03936 family radical SAM-associated protein [Spirochaetaceae bacterium]|nr:TIGR03936 family radical SAM-associated protein [Spirochaetaceae bacterium]